MPFKTIWEQKGAIQRFWGSIHINDLHEADKELYRDYRFDDIKYLIIDCLDVSETCLNETHMEEVAYTDNVVASYKRHLKMAFICKLPELEKQMRDYINHSTRIRNKWDIRFFNDLKSAEDWAKS